MEKYIEFLEKIAYKEIFSAILLIAILFIIVVFVWISNYIRFKKMKNKSSKKYNSEKQIKVRREIVCASIVLSVICFGMGAFLCLNAVNTISEINKDIDENAFVTYNGEYCVEDDYFLSSYALYNRHLTVDFANDDYAFIYINSFSERISKKEGTFEGTLVYGKNSLIVVDIEEQDS